MTCREAIKGEYTIEDWKEPGVGATMETWEAVLTAHGLKRKDFKWATGGGALDYGATARASGVTLVIVRPTREPDVSTTTTTAGDGRNQGSAGAPSKSI